MSKQKKLREVNVFGTFTGQIVQLIEWLEQNTVKHVALESTGIYWVLLLWNQGVGLPGVCRNAESKIILIRTKTNR